MKKLFLVLLFLPALSFAQNLEQVEGRLTMLESLVGAMHWHLLDANAVQIGETLPSELGSSLALVEIAIALSGTNDGQYAFVRIKEAGLLVFGDGGTFYPNNDCTGDPILINDSRTGLILTQGSRITIDGKIMIIDPDMPIVINQSVQSLATISLSEVIECTAVGPFDVDGNAGIVIFDPAANPGPYKLDNV